MTEWNLSDRERETLATVARVGSAKLAAREMGISHRTVEIYLAKVRTKMKTNHTLLAVLEWDRYVFRRMCDCKPAE